MIFFSKLKIKYRVRNLKLKGKPKLKEWTQPSGSTISAAPVSQSGVIKTCVSLTENRLVRFMNSKLGCRGVLQQHSRSYWGRLWVVCQGGTICWQIGWVRQKHFRRKSECQNLDFMDEKNHRHSSENRRSSRKVWMHILISVLCNIFIVSSCSYSAYFSGGRHSMRLTLVFVMTWLMRRSRAAGLTISSRETRTNSTTATHGESHTKTWWQDLNLSSWSWRGKTVYLSLDIRLSTGKMILNHRNGNKVHSFY